MSQYTPPKSSLLTHLNKIKASNALGRASNLSRLLEYLIQKEIKVINSGEISPHSPKEIEIAIEVFDKTVDFNPSEDSSVRVHISRLRKKLVEYYDSEGKNESFKIVIPTGEYRLIFIENNEKTDVNTMQLVGDLPNIDTNPVVNINNKNRLIIFALTTIIILQVVIFYTSSSPTKIPPKTHAIWESYQQSGNNIIVLGDALDINDQEKEISRPAGMHEEKQMSKSIILALKNALSIHNSFRYMPIKYSSELSVYDIKHANIIYIGNFSNMGMLSNYFNGSELDYSAATRTISTATSDYTFQSPSESNLQYDDYGLFAKIKGPRENHIYIISGFTDSSLLWLSWYLTTSPEPDSKQFDQSISDYLSNRANNFELLFRVSSMNGEDIGHELISSSNVNSKLIWQQF